MMTQQVQDTITIEPVIAGRYGRAWMVDIEAQLARVQKTRADDAGVISWVVEAAWAHPVWHSYWITLVHLRPMPDLRQTKFYLEGATHELWVMALNPENPRQRFIEGIDPPRPLAPMNFAAQIIEPNDAEAAERVEFAVREICDGALSPDTDFISLWASRFGSNMRL